jgi:hypothetical protein
MFEPMTPDPTVPVESACGCVVKPSTGEWHLLCADHAYLRVHQTFGPLAHYAEEALAHG